jgi:hypothetical protein
MRNIAKKVSSHLKWRLLPRMISDVRLLGRPAKNADPYATLEALERLSRAATGIILIGIALELAWGIWTFENWPSFFGDRNSGYSHRVGPSN